MGADRQSWPAWVRIGLWGVMTRSSAWTFFWLAVALCVACVGLGFVDWRFWIAGAIGPFAALWYYLAIQWVDSNSSWT
jgi:hypothetical protein